MAVDIPGSGASQAPRRGRLGGISTRTTHRLNTTCNQDSRHDRGRSARGMILLNLIRRVRALSAATAMAALVTVAASACGGATTATGPPTNGLEKKSPADVLQRPPSPFRPLRASTSRGRALRGIWTPA